jgi:queuine tRNA-ribosyltransferase
VTVPRFEVLCTDAGGARLGRLTLAHGVVDTPAFMPVATHGSVKGITPAQLEDLGATIVLSNAYHLGQRPGVDVVSALGGIHRLMGWTRPILTDSGGFQVMSLAGLVTVSDEGVCYRSHVDGRRGELRPEDAVAVQEDLGVDVAMSLDECVPAAAPPATVARAVARTTAWAAGGCAHGAVRTWPCSHRAGRARCDPACRSAPRCWSCRSTAMRSGPVRRRASARDRTVAAETVRLLPDRAPRYLMGMGTPRDLLTFAGLGYDLFDCVLPTRNARNGMLFTREGRLMIRNARHVRDSRPLDESCTCYTCRHFSRGTLRHLALAKEMLGAQLATLHNLHFYLTLMREIRADLSAGSFPARARAAAGAWA